MVELSVYTKGRTRVAPAFPRFRATRSNWKTQAHTGRLFVDYAALSNNRGVSDQLGAFGRKRIHFDGNWRLNAGVEHVLLRATGVLCKHIQVTLVSQRESADKSR